MLERDTSPTAYTAELASCLALSVLESFSVLAAPESPDAVASVDASVDASCVAASGFVLNLASATPDASLISDIQSVTLTGLPVCTTIESFTVASGATVSLIFTVTLYSFLS